MFETAVKRRQPRRASRYAVLVLAAALAGPLVWAQSNPPPRAAADDAPGLVLGGVPFRVGQLGVEGVTVFEPAALLRFATALHHDVPGRVHTPQSVAQAMAQIYREDGYPLAEVTWRADAATGTLVWVVSEGHIDQVTLVGLDDATKARTLRYLTSLTQLRPLKQADLERALALADDLAGTSLHSRLVPSELGQGSVLQVVGEQFKRQGGLVMDVVPMRPGYARRLHGHEARYGLLAPGDLMRLHGTLTQEPSAGTSVLGTLSYRTPVGDEGDYVEVVAGNARSERGLGNTLERSELRGQHASLAWGRPYQRDLHSYSYWIAALEHADSTARLGVRQPRSQATAARLYWVQGNTSPTQHLAQYGLTLSAGQRPNSGGAVEPDGSQRFQHLRGGVGWSGPWSMGETVLSYRAEAAAQWTTRPLPRVERFVLGHFPYLRGYAPGEVDGDRGAGFSVEVVRQGDAHTGVAGVRPFVFVSAGRVATVKSGATPAVAWSLASVGLGLRAQLGGRVGLETWAAVPLRDGPQSRRGDPAWFLSLSVPL